MKTIEETRRGMFEAWFLKHKPITGPDMLKEGSFVPEWMFEGWCAALDAVVIELPSGVKRAFHEYDLGYNEALDRCESAIESTNLGLKIR
jgi:hypothetical protein